MSSSPLPTRVYVLVLQDSFHSVDQESRIPEIPQSTRRAFVPTRCCFAVVEKHGLQPPNEAFSSVSVTYSSSSGNFPVVVEGVPGKLLVYYFDYKVLSESYSGLQLCSHRTELAWCKLPVEGSYLGKWLKLPVEWDYQFAVTKGVLSVGDWKVPKAKVIAIFHGLVKKRPSFVEEDVPWFNCAGEPGAEGIIHPVLSGGYKGLWSNFLQGFIENVVQETLNILQRLPKEFDSAVFRIRFQLENGDMRESPAFYVS